MSEKEHQEREESGMHVEYLRTAKKSYMIVKGAEFPFPAYEEKMLLRNAIPCLLPFQVIRSDGAAEYCYDVSGMQSLKTLFSLENLGSRRLCFLLEHLMEAKVAMEEYLLDDADICFSAETVWFDHAAERIRFCYIPGLGAAGAASGAGGGEERFRTMNLQSLFEEILQHLDHADSVAVRMGYEMYERCARGSFDMADCADCLQIGEAAARPEAEPVVAERTPRWEEERSDSEDLEMNVENLEDVDFLFTESKQPKRHFGRQKREETRDAHSSAERKRGHGRETNRGGAAEWARETWRRWRGDVEPEEDELLFALQEEAAEISARTEVLSANEAAPAWRLVYKGSGLESDLVLTTFPFLVGTDNNRVNGVLLARTVSRVHAKLDLRDGKLYVEDFNSTNGTYVNHTLLPMNTPTVLAEGDRVVFATEEYEVFRRHAFESIGLS